MLNPYVEHQNLTVPDLDLAIARVLALIPQWRLRARRKEYMQSTFGDKPFSLDWAHLGDDHSYIALQAPSDGEAFIANPQPYFNHLGIVVPDLASCLERAAELGLEAKASPAHPARRRAYVKVVEGLMLELIQYLDEDPAQRHSYGA
ncbi:VOC family protein [Gallaecimonas kandeliae]|uniref:VOC family protein n=1 Tax=Gallaecimonas kandeliae TaxID=3029055 RepID=UPI00264777BD|nr:VOC family protein [Gallaecimonas kandeliae]WKE65757.1 VOC family protein [Gallaecimonas kandeliae]